MHKEEFIKEVKKLGIELNNKQLDQLEEYYNILIEYNNHTNLTRITEKQEVYLKHFYDSITLIKAIELNNQSIIDVGTGAGFPGIVLKIVFPNLKVTLVDSLNKRVTFLNEVINKLDLKDIEAIHSRAEDYAQYNREKYDIVTSRAVANLRTLSELCIPLLKVNGYFIPMKADSDEEIKESSTALTKLNSFIEETITFNLPKELSKRTLIKIKKIKETNIKYPRKFNEIKKKPL